MREAAIVSTARTAIGKAYRGAFNDTEAPVLSAHVVDAASEIVFRFAPRRRRSNSYAKSRFASLLSAYALDDEYARSP